MTTPPKKTYRKRYLFPRLLTDVVKQATKPMMDKQGKLYGALIRDWAVIVGDARATISTPKRLQFPTTEAAGATLHLEVHPAHAPELQYATAQIIEQCARYFGYKAIDRVVIHADYAQVKPSSADTGGDAKAKEARPDKAEAIRMLAALRTQLQSGDDK